MSEPVAPKTAEPTSLSAALTEFIVKHEPGSRMHALGTDLLKAHGKNRDRRAAVLKHEDLAKRLVTELGYAKAEHWNGYIPPAFTDPGGHEQLCSTVIVGAHGELRFRFSQLGRYAIGERPNNSHRRKVLLEISQEAWDRQHPAPEGPPHD